MATTIQSGRSNSPKLTADVASRAEVYGGRGLVFDGSTDYLDCGESLCNSLGDNYSGGLTVSMWFNANALLRGLFSMGTSFSSYIGLFTLSFNNNKLVWDLANANYEESSALSTGQWYQVTAVLDTNSESNTILYINGKSDMNLNGSGSFPSVGGLDFQAVSKIIIGGYYSTSYLFDGKICNLKIFDTALTEAQVQELYKKPENTPSAVQDNLVAWYPMSESNPESPQSIVYDHSEKKLGSEKLGTWTNSASVPWTTWTSSGTTVSSAISNGSGTMIATNPFSSVSGSLYKITFNFTSNSGGVPDFTLRETTTGTIGDGSNAFGTVVSGLNTHYFQASSTKTLYMFFSVSSATSNFSLSDVSVKEVLMGQNATTNFFGDEIFTDGDFEASGTTSWDDHVDSHEVTLAKDTGTVKSGSKSLKITRVSGKGGFAQAVTGLDTSKQYRYTGWVYSNSDNIALAYKNDSQIGISPTTLETITTTGQWVFFDHTFTPPASTTYIGGWKSVDDSFAFLDDFSLKEVGISSNGFLPVTNEPTIPQIPLVKYNEKLLFDGLNDYVETTTNNDIFPDGANYSISCWVSLTSYNSADNHLFVIPSELKIKSDTSGRIIIYADGSSSNNIITNATLTDSNFHHLVIVYDGSLSGNTNRIKCYVDGVLIGTSSNSGTIPSTLGSTSKKLRIGADNVWMSGVTKGVIDEFSIFATSFSATEVQELFNDGLALDATTHSKAGNLLSYHRNDGVTTWTDRSTNSNHGTVAGTPDAITIREGLNSNKDGLGFPLTDSIGNVLRLNGSSEYVKANFTNTTYSVYTISCWIKANSLSNWIRIIQVDSSNERYLGLHGDGKVISSYYSGSWSALYTTATLSTDRWYYLTLVDDDTQTKIYIDDGSPETLANSIQITNPYLYIGTHEGNGNFFDGLVDEVKFYNRELSATEIQKNYKHGKGKHKND